MYIYGKNSIKEAIYAQHKIEALYIDKAFKDAEFFKWLKSTHIPFERIDKGRLGQLAGSSMHQGIVALVEPYHYTDLESLLKKEGIKRFIILDSIEDPHNLGAILRTAEATQMTAIIMSEKQQVPLNATVAKVSSGAIEHVKVCLVPQLFKGIELLKSYGVTVFGTDMNTTKSFKEMDLRGSIAVVLGNEGKGLRPLVKKACDDLIFIPMKGHIQSLNVSVAAALLMYELMV